MAAKRPRSTWGSHSRKFRDRVSKEAQTKYGLSRRSVREMYNRGTFTPAARNPEDRVPLKIQKSRGRYIGGDGLSAEQLREMVYRKFDRLYDTSIRWVPDAQDRVRESLRHLDVQDLHILLAMDDNDMQDLAKYQRNHIANRSVPKLVRDLAWKDPNGHYHNPFWYH